MNQSLPVGTPSRVNLNRQANRLQLEWPDGWVGALSGADLRRYCACASCRARGRIGMLLVTDDTNVANIQLIGAGVQIVFADGHDRGIYPWPYLRAIAEGRVQELFI